MSDFTEWPSVAEAAQQLKTSKRSIQRLIARGQIEAQRRPQAGRKPETVCNPDDVRQLQPAAHVMPADRDTATARHVGDSPQKSPQIFPTETALSIETLFAALASLTQHLQPPPHTKRWLLLAEASDEYGLSERFLRAAILRGELTAVRDERAWKIDRHSLDTFQPPKQLPFRSTAGRDEPS